MLLYTWYSRVCSATHFPPRCSSEGLHSCIGGSCVAMTGIQTGAKSSFQRRQTTTAAFSRLMSDHRDGVSELLVHRRVDSLPGAGWSPASECTIPITASLCDLHGIIEFMRNAGMYQEERTTRIIWNLIIDSLQAPLSHNEMRNINEIYY